MLGVLDNPNNDRERNQWDIYVLQANDFGSNSYLQQLSLKRITLSLQGTDGWHIEEFRVAVYGEFQSGGATGNSIIATRPNVWLDNNNSDPSIMNFYESNDYTNAGVVAW